MSATASTATSKPPDVPSIPRSRRLTWRTTLSHSPQTLSPREYGLVRDSAGYHLAAAPARATPDPPFDEKFGRRRITGERKVAASVARPPKRSCQFPIPIGSREPISDNGLQRHLCRRPYRSPRPIQRSFPHDADATYSLSPSLLLEPMTYHET